jgi:hypothetical protein
MRILALASMGCLASLAAAQPVSSNVTSILPADVDQIYSINFERYADSAFQLLYPMPQENFGQCAGKVRQVIVAQRSLGAGGGQLAILIGTPAPPDCEGHQTGDTIGPAPTVMDADTAVIGDPDLLRSAAERWRQGSGPADQELAFQVRRMTELYDNWLIAIRPLKSVAAGNANTSQWTYSSQLAELVQVVRAGVRLGTTNQVEAEVEMKTADDATAAAGLGRWLRGFVQAMSKGPEAALAEVAENLSVTASGNVLSIPTRFAKSPTRCALNKTCLTWSTAARSLKATHPTSNS